MHIPFDFVILRLNANIAGDFRIFPFSSFIVDFIVCKHVSIRDRFQF